MDPDLLGYLKDARERRRAGVSFSPEERVKLRGALAEYDRQRSAIPAREPSAREDWMPRAGTYTPADLGPPPEQESPFEKLVREGREAERAQYQGFAERNPTLAKFTDPVMGPKAGLAADLRESGLRRRTMEQNPGAFIKQEGLLAPVKAVWSEARGPELMDVLSKTFFPPRVVMETIARSAQVKPEETWAETIGDVAEKGLAQTRTHEELGQDIGISPEHALGAEIALGFGTDPGVVTGLPKLFKGVLGKVAPKSRLLATGREDFAARGLLDRLKDAKQGSTYRRMQTGELVPEAGAVGPGGGPAEGPPEWFKSRTRDLQEQDARAHAKLPARNPFSEEPVPSRQMEEIVRHEKMLELLRGESLKPTPVGMTREAHLAELNKGIAEEQQIIAALKSRVFPESVLDDTGPTFLERMKDAVRHPFYKDNPEAGAVGPGGGPGGGPKKKGRAQKPKLDPELPGMRDPRIAEIQDLAAKAEAKGVEVEGLKEARALLANMKESPSLEPPSAILAEIHARLQRGLGIKGAPAPQVPAPSGQRDFGTLEYGTPPAPAPAPGPGPKPIEGKSRFEQIAPELIRPEAPSPPVAKEPPPGLLARIKLQNPKAVNQGDPFVPHPDADRGGYVPRVSATSGSPQQQAKWAVEDAAWTEREIQRIATEEGRPVEVVRREFLEAASPSEPPPGLLARLRPEAEPVMPAQGMGPEQAALAQKLIKSGVPVDDVRARVQASVGKQSPTSPLAAVPPAPAETPPLPQARPPGPDPAEIARARQQQAEWKALMDAERQPAPVPPPAAPGLLDRLREATQPPKPPQQRVVLAETPQATVPPAPAPPAAQPPAPPKPPAPPVGPPAPPPGGPSPSADIPPAAYTLTRQHLVEQAEPNPMTRMEAYGREVFWENNLREQVTAGKDPLAARQEASRKTGIQVSEATERINRIWKGTSQGEWEQALAFEQGKLPSVAPELLDRINQDRAVYSALERQHLVPIERMSGRKIGRISGYRGPEMKSGLEKQIIPTPKPTKPPAPAPPVDQPTKPPAPAPPVDQPTKPPAPAPPVDQPTKPPTGPVPESEPSMPKTPRPDLSPGDMIRRPYQGVSESGPLEWLEQNHIEPMRNSVQDATIQWKAESRPLVQQIHDIRGSVDDHVAAMNAFELRGDPGRTPRASAQALSPKAQQLLKIVDMVQSELENRAVATPVTFGSGETDIAMGLERALRKSAYQDIVAPTVQKTMDEIGNFPPQMQTYTRGQIKQMLAAPDEAMANLSAVLNPNLKAFGLKINAFTNAARAKIGRPAQPPSPILSDFVGSSNTLHAVLSKGSYAAKLAFNVLARIFNELSDLTTFARAASQHGFVKAGKAWGKSFGPAASATWEAFEVMATGKTTTNPLVLDVLNRHVTNPSNMLGADVIRSRGAGRLIDILQQKGAEGWNRSEVRAQIRGYLANVKLNEAAGMSTEAAARKAIRDVRQTQGMYGPGTTSILTRSMPFRLGGQFLIWGENLAENLTGVFSRAANGDIAAMKELGITVGLLMGMDYLLRGHAEVPGESTAETIMGLDFPNPLSASARGTGAGLVSAPWFTDIYKATQSAGQTGYRLLTGDVDKAKESGTTAARRLFSAQFPASTQIGRTSSALLNPSTTMSQTGFRAVLGNNPLFAPKPTISWLLKRYDGLRVDANRSPAEWKELLEIKKRLDEHRRQINLRRDERRSAAGVR